MIYRLGRGESGLRFDLLFDVLDDELLIYFDIQHTLTKQYNNELMHYM